MFQKTYLSPNPATGQKGTKFTTADANTITQELCNIITSVGWQPNASQSGQVASVLTNFYATLNSPKLSGIPTTTNPDGTVANQIATVDYVNQKALSATVGFTPTQQGGGTGMGTDKIYIGTSSSDASNFLIQSDNNAGLYLTLGEDDVNTYGIRRLGYNHSTSTMVALDSNGFWHNLAEQSWVNGKFLPLTGGELSGSLTVDSQFSIKNGLSIAGNIIGNSASSIQLVPSTGLTNRLDVGIDHLGYYQNSSSATFLVNSSGTTINNNLTVNTSLYVGSKFSYNYNSGKPYIQFTDIHHREVPNGDIIWNSTTSLPDVDTTQGNNHSWGTWSNGAYKFYATDTNVHLWTTINSAGLTTSGTLTANQLSSDGGAVTTNGSGTLAATAITASSITATKSLVYDNGSGQAEMNFSNGGKIRWAVGKDAAAETGSNNGGNFVIARFDDSGTYVGNPITIPRSTGVVTIGNGILVPTQSTSDNSKNAASTAYVKNNLANYAALNSYPTFQGINLNNGTAGASIYADANLADIVFHTNDGNDHYSYFNANGNLTLSGNLNASSTIATTASITASGNISNNGTVYTNTVSVNTASTLTLAGNVSTTGTLSQNGSAVATQTWVIDNAVATPNITSGSGDTRVEALIWSGSNNAPYIVHFQSDGSTSAPVLLASESWVGSHYQPVGSYITAAQYAADFSTASIGQIPLPYGNRIEAFTVPSVGTNGTIVTFPTAFSGNPVCIVVTTYYNGDMDLFTYGWSSTGFTIRCPSNSTYSNQPASVLVVGPK